MRVPVTDTPHIAQLLRKSDYFRRSPARLGGRSGYKEWQHFIVHARDVHLLVNFSIADEASPGRSKERGEVARLIALASGDGWEGGVERFDEADFAVESGDIQARLGRNTLRFERNTYRLSMALRERSLAAELEFVPAALPAVSANHLLAPGRHISWLFLPRLETRGTITLHGRTTRVEGAPAYHDHNWGHFTWGDDFCWEWGSLLPKEAANPWSAVLVRMMNRARSAVRYQALFLWHGGEALRVFRDEELQFSNSGDFAMQRPFTLPRPLALLVPGAAADLPRALEVQATGDADSLQVGFEPRQHARIIVPAEEALERLTVIHEMLGAVSLRGCVRGEQVDMEGTGVFEFIRG